MPNQRCADPHCGVFVTADHPLCSRHRTGHESGLSDPDLDHAPTPYEQGLDTRSLQAFRVTDVNSLIQEAAREVSEHGIFDELGALRIVLHRLVTEQHDLNELTRNVTSVARVAIQAARAQLLINGQDAGAVAGVLTQILIEIKAARESATKVDRS